MKDEIINEKFLISFLHNNKNNPIATAETTAHIVAE
jgi:hypothetical protein